ncbi:MAG TPA: STM3941 family protein, partial [Candidatus Angelobacter sp.]
GFAKIAGQNKLMSFPQDSDYLAQLTPDALVLYPSRAKLALFALLCALFLAGGFGMWNDSRIEYKVGAVADWIFFGLALLLFISRLVQRVPSLIVNQSGIFDSSSRISAYFLRWEEIDSVYISSLGRQRFLSLRLRDPEAFLSRQSPMKAKIMRANIKLVGAPVNISASTLPLKLEELLSVIQQKAPAVRVS